MDWPAIKAEINRRGGTIIEIAKDLGVTASTVSQVKNKHNKRAEAAIAAFIGKTALELWPDRYHKKPRQVSNAYRRFLATKNFDQEKNNAAMVNEKQKMAV
ncbi:helix-turn-helix domain-containing protein [Candidatus Tokpelaia sp.]|uniref:helix-turn-helix domain-containing protein n=1 Tax=Candidatus Tokpelaia sp. TaxID=2233777 RepID=UPI0012396350|nr:helix-turn-helix domain-containing protein [Candidatus Tokpelaia sp.]KAA6405057.1 Nlp family transcriptional regulator [Candidatus Tokpelaia sp.]